MGKKHKEEKFLRDIVGEEIASELATKQWVGLVIRTAIKTGISPEVAEAEIRRQGHKTKG